MILLPPDFESLPQGNGPSLWERGNRQGLTPDPCCVIGLVKESVKESTRNTGDAICYMLLALGLVDAAYSRIVLA